MIKINVKLILLFILVAALAGYFFYQGRGYLSGPEIIIESLYTGEVVHDSYIAVKGHAFNISALTLNGRQIFTDEKGFFNEGLLLARGYNIIELTATDKFDRIKKERLEVVLQ